MKDDRKQGAWGLPRRWWLLVLAGIFCACGTPERYAYLGDAAREEAQPIASNYSSTIFPGDLLYIHVSSNTPEAVIPFNEETNSAMLRTGKEVVRGRRTTKGYLVGEEGDFQFPVLGKIHAAGLTYEGLARDIEARLVERRLVKDPVVVVELKNFHVAVIGEVAVPTLLHAQGTRLTIFEALAQCGDITIHGRRDNVTVVRFGGEQVVVDTVDLTSKSVLTSACYYLQQGDIVYVEPTRKRKREASRNETWPTYANITLQSLRVAYVMVYRYAIDPTTRVTK
ncbi:MAG: polysaccharide biosynthesis/export family protein [Bacteroidales bacterium]|nr:polysaccharide biosynthesis/export family protein [Bacteroidales bacterium]